MACVHHFNANTVNRGEGICGFNGESSEKSHPYYVAETEEG